MTWRVVLAPRAIKDFEAIREPDRSRIAARLQELARDPRPFGAVKLRESDFYRIRIGDWRALYSIDDREGLVVAVRILRRSERTYRDV